MDTRKKLIELLNDHTCLEDKDDCAEECSACIADHLIAHGVTVQEWIPVTDRLPEKEGRYLCVVRIGYKSGAVYVQIMNGDRRGFSLAHIYNDDVAHGMPLPEPPKEGA